MNDPVTGDGGGRGPPREVTAGLGDSTRTDRTRRTLGPRASRLRSDGTGAAAGVMAAADLAERAPSVAVYVRGLPGCRERERAVVETLEALAERGALGEVAVHTWPEQVSLTGAGAAHSELVEDYQTFAAWADAHDASVRPPFVVRTVDSSITDERDEVLVTPALLVAVWADDDLVSVYPHCHENGVASVEDGLAALLAGTEPDTEDPASGRDTVLLAERATPTDGGEEPEVNTDEN